ncbi:YlqD family protein [Tepidibacillus infernus]|uniref:16S rRNA processing protein RimM n=1 Tax=Tepidibacillus decaturensis TaxID=1413211 RepID=A0A135L3S5_9BACI|nr:MULTISPECIES: YlqD family protein [Tepidibacillus]KXG43684.1 hypothetical protein U473_06385 [Tepidibacillus decaturensis]GBF11646.1 hypothetical protein HK1_01684 [Tepidibacillus sp. HK-1]
MKIKIPVPVKMVVTNQSKQLLVTEIEQSMKQIKVELEQLKFQQKKLLTEAEKKGKEAVRIVQDRIGYEHQKRKEKLEQLVVQLEQVEKLNIGDEIFHSTVDTEIEVNVGDHWDQIFHRYEIIIKDGIITEIRKRVE